MLRARAQKFHWYTGFKIARIRGKLQSLQHRNDEGSKQHSGKSTAFRRVVTNCWLSIIIKAAILWSSLRALNRRRLFPSAAKPLWTMSITPWQLYRLRIDLFVSRSTINHREGPLYDKSSGGPSCEGGPPMTHPVVALGSRNQISSCVFLNYCLEATTATLVMQSLCRN